MVADDISVEKFDPDQPRDDHGRFGEGGGGAADAHAPGSSAKPSAKWSAGELKSAKGTLDLMALQARDRVRPGADWKEAWDKHIATQDNLKRLVQAGAESDIARHGPTAASSRAMAIKARAEFDEGVASGKLKGTQIATRQDYVNRMDKYASDHEKNLKHATAVRDKLSNGDLPQELLTYKPTAFGKGISDVADDADAEKSANRPAGGPARPLGMAQAPARHKLRLSKLEFLSLVDRPAQAPATVRLIKRADAGDEIEVKATAQIVKVSSGDDPLIYAWAFQCVGEDGQVYADLQGDEIQEDFVKAAEEFMRSGGAVDRMHEGSQTSHVAFAFPMDSDIAKSMFGAPGEAIKTVGLMTAIRPSTDDLAGVRSGKYTGVSIAGTGIRVGKSDSKCAKCSAYMKSGDTECPACGVKTDAAKSVSKTIREEDGKYVLYTADGEKKLSEHDTKDEAEAQERAIQANKGVPAKTRSPGGPRARKRLRKQAVLTSTADGHQHQIDLDDPSDQWFGDKLRTTEAVADGSEQPHGHDWIFDAATGAITIAESAGHSHTVDSVVPADVLAEAALNEDGERCRKCGQMCEGDSRFCPSCGASLSDASNGVPKATCSDEDGGSGPKVIAISLRAPDSNSPPPEASPSVDNVDKEHAPMATDALQILTKRHEDLEKRNTFLEKFAQLTDAEKAHYGKLVGQDQDVFLNKGTLDRQVEISEIAKADEVIYTSPVTGEVFRKSCSPRELKLQKQADEATIALRVESQKRADGELARKGAELLNAFSKGAKGNLQMRLMKAVNAEFTDPTDYEEVVEALKGMNTAMVEASKPKGYTPQIDTSAVADPKAQLETLAKRYADENKVDFSKAYTHVLNTPQGAALYAAADRVARA